MEPPPEASEMAITRYWHCEAAPPVGVPPPDAPAYWLEMEAPEGPSYWKCILELPTSHTPSVPPPINTTPYLGHYHWERHTGEPPAEGEYYHCTGAPAAPGTRPDEDPEHWEPVEPPEGIEDGESVFGWDEEGSGWLTFGNDAGGIFLAMLAPFPSGEPIGVVDEHSGGVWMDWPNWPSTTPTGETAPQVLSVHVIYDAGHRAVAAQAYLFYSTTEGLSQAAAVGIYDANGDFVGASEPVVKSSSGAEWVHFEFATPVQLQEGENYYICLWGENTPEDGWQVAVEHLAAYTPPDGGEWDDERDYHYCQTVYLPPEGETILPDPWHPETTYKVGDVVRYNPVYLEWDPTEENYKWGNFVYYTEPTARITIRDGIIAADKEPHHTHKMTLIDTVKAKVFHRFVAPCFGRYIRPPWAIRGGQRD